MRFNSRRSLPPSLKKLSKLTNRRPKMERRPKPKSTSNNNELYAKLGILMDNARNKPEDLFQALNVKLVRQGRRYVGRCPVHGGRSSDSCHFYPDGYKGTAFWECLSHHCEQHFKGNVVGFVRGVLSHQNKGWAEPEDDETPFQESVDWLCNFLDMPWHSIKADMSLAEQNQFIAGVEVLTLSTQTCVSKGICSRNRLRNFLEIPAEVYLNRGFTPEILDRYDVGLCQHPKSELYGRVVVPFYDNDARYVIGCIGRSTHSECPKCGTYHHVNADCYVPGTNMRDFAKVQSMEYFKVHNYLYNYWFAKDDILRTRCVVIVEGCADVWRLEESGITNAVALNGAALSEPQLITLECSGATEIVCLTDNDEAGERAYESIVKKCWFANTKRPVYEGKDIGELDILTLKQYQFYKELKYRLEHGHGRPDYSMYGRS